MLEVVITLVCAALLVLNCIVMQSLFQKEVATFIVTCVTGAGLGYVVAIFEERWSPFDEYYGKLSHFSQLFIGMLVKTSSFSPSYPAFPGGTSTSSLREHPGHSSTSPFMPAQCNNSPGFHEMPDILSPS
ncbi:hypothetical protein Ocin01_17271 [Orchesella cincta]|uniref:Uncharacterized protein n=1 Tax=Orchesella cincta TaxID=48709 RepID=A0A1D2M8W5_ORCCI|nr:hypothetical protein Ocin01_17271 [Orchesella cincta]